MHRTTIADAIMCFIFIFSFKNIYVKRYRKVGLSMTIKVVEIIPILV